MPGIGHHDILRRVRANDLIKNRQGILPTVQASDSGGLPRGGMKSIFAKLRELVFLLCAMLLTVSLVALWVIRIQVGNVRYLSSTVTPAVEINGEIFRNMTAAQIELRLYETSRNPELFTSYSAMQVHVMAGQVELRNKLRELADHGRADAVFHTDLLLRQEVSVQRWWSYALNAGQTLAQGINVDISQSVTLFANFRLANSELNESLGSELNQARRDAERASEAGLTVVIAVAFMALVAALILGRRFARSISLPILDLHDVISRRRDGESGARAREDEGFRETRSLAHELNAFMDNEFDLQQIQARALSLHDLTVEIRHAIRTASSIQESLEIMCDALGNGLGVDRVMVNTMYGDQGVMLRAQWHMPGLPSVHDLPDEMVPHIIALGKELWSSLGHLVSNDRLASEEQSERAQIFYRHTGARAVIVTPIGLGDEAIGMIYVVTVHEPRQWAESEVDAVGRVAAFLEETIAEDTYRTQQREHIERLERFERQQTNFVETVSHELRTPLTSITGYLEVLRDGYVGVLTEEQQRMLEVMDRNTNRLNRLIENLLASNQSENDGSKADFVQLSMGELITDACNELPPIAQSVAIALAIDAVPEAAIVRGDKKQLESAVVNIVSNAIKFSRPGGVVTITCTLDEDMRRVRLTCQDRGIGIPAADQGRLFTRFFRASNAVNQEIPGTGLGLSIVKQIIHDHGGQVRLASVEGEGTTVVIDLPLFAQISS